MALDFSLLTLLSGMQVTAADYTGITDIVPLQRRTLEEQMTEISFEFRKQRFCWDAEARHFEKLQYPTQVKHKRSASTRHLSPRQSHSLDILF